MMGEKTFFDLLLIVEDFPTNVLVSLVNSSSRNSKDVRHLSLAINPIREKSIKMKATPHFLCFAVLILG